MNTSKWTLTTEEKYDEMLGVLPPALALMLDRGFLVGEPMDHDPITGRPRYSAFRRIADQYFESNAPMTTREFREEMK